MNFAKTSKCLYLSRQGKLSVSDTRSHSIKLKRKFSCWSIGRAAGPDSHGRRRAVCEGGLVEEMVMVQLACMEINSIQQVYGQVEGRSGRDFERCSCPQAVPVQLISSLVKMAHSMGRGEAWTCLWAIFRSAKGQWDKVPR